MCAEIQENTINTYSKNNLKKKYISPIVTSAANFITEEINTNIPNSESNFISTENEEKINGDENSKKKIKLLKLNNNRFILSKNININEDINKEREKNNEEIYNCLMKYEDMKNIKNIKELNDIFEHEQTLNFILSRLNKNQSLKCNIFLENENNSINYILYTHTHKFILSAKYDFSLFHCNYIIFTSRNFLPITAISKLHSYSNKTEFILYDMGIPPKSLKNKKINTNNNSIKMRRYLLQINFLNNKKFQNLIVYLPKDDFFQNYFYNMDENHKDKLNNKNLENDVDIFENNKPKYDINLKKYWDNFSNRIKEKSKFNFKILSNNKDNKNNIAIECGKINDNNFALDISYPFSPLEGFAIALANFIRNK